MGEVVPTTGDDVPPMGEVVPTTGDDVHPTDPLETKIPSGDENCGDEYSVYFLGDEYSSGDENSENVGDESSEKSWRRNFQRRKFRTPGFL